MARVLSASGRKRIGPVGGESYRVVRGVTVVQEKSLGPTNEATPIQIGNRAAMKLLVEFSLIIRGALNAGFKEGKTPSKPGKAAKTIPNAFTSVNRKYDNVVFNYAFPDSPVFQPQFMVVSKGSIEKTNITSAGGDISDQSVTITWPGTNFGVAQSETDKLWVAIHNQTQNKWFVSGTGAARSAGTATFTNLNTKGFAFVTGDAIRAYVFFEGVDPNDSTILTGKASGSDNLLVTLTP